ncbi:hypothetical protein WISP_115828 [Willisornis vidua]|uniref:Uncharacterized protein n=1 Tax=Willisornis vidua TaxID=1566151 RepID=A0ABQ9CU32_9PASS|nr:hypothetical protein WISP_115828 [Willisornis vidua]
MVPPESKVKRSEKPVGADDSCSLVKSGGHSPVEVLISSGSDIWSPKSPDPQDYSPSGPGGNTQYLPQGGELHNGWSNSVGHRVFGIIDGPLADMTSQAGCGVANKFLEGSYHSSYLTGVFHTQLTS